MAFSHALAFLLALAPGVYGHGKLTSPAARNGGNTGADGGIVYSGGVKHNYRHGVCGNKVGEIQEYNAVGPIQAYYTEGQTIDLTVSVMAGHGGYFEFSLCLNASDLTEECFAKHHLIRALCSCRCPLGSYGCEACDACRRWYKPLTQGEVSLWPSTGYVEQGSPVLAGEGNVRAFEFKMKYVLPVNTKSKNAVLRWHYVTTDTCLNGFSAPEEFWNCADVAITDPRSQGGNVTDIYGIQGHNVTEGQSVAISLDCSTMSCSGADQYIRWAVGTGSSDFQLSSKFKAEKLDGTAVAFVLWAGEAQHHIGLDGIGISRRRRGKHEPGQIFYEGGEWGDTTLLGTSPLVPGVFHTITVRRTDGKVTLSMDGHDTDLHDVPFTSKVTAVGWRPQRNTIEVESLYENLEAPDIIYDNEALKNLPVKNLVPLMKQGHLPGVVTGCPHDAYGNLQGIGPANAYQECGAPIADGYENCYTTQHNYNNTCSTNSAGIMCNSDDFYFQCADGHMWTVPVPAGQCCKDNTLVNEDNCIGPIPMPSPTPPASPTPAPEGSCTAVVGNTAGCTDTLCHSCADGASSSVFPCNVYPPCCSCMQGYAGPAATSAAANGTDAAFAADAASEAAKEQMSQQFQALDKNNDGVLSQEETDALLQSLIDPNEVVPEDCMANGVACHTCINNNVCQDIDKSICDFNHYKWCGAAGVAPCDMWTGANCLIQEWALSGQKIRIPAAGAGVSTTAVFSLLGLSLVPVGFRWFHDRRHLRLPVTDEAREVELEA